MATDFIKLEDAIALTDQHCFESIYDAVWMEEELRKLPAADVRPVVTCGKCKYGKYTGTSWLCDKHSGHADKFGEDASYYEYHSKHWFCADGEERNHA